MKSPAAASDAIESAPMLKSTMCSGERRVLQSTSASASAIASAARGPDSAGRAGRTAQGGRRLRGRLVERKDPRPAALYEQRILVRREDPVATLQLRAVDGEVRVVDELVRILAVPRRRGHAHRDRRPDRLARRLDLELARRDR